MEYIKKRKISPPPHENHYFFKPNIFVSMTLFVYFGPLWTMPHPMRG